MSAFNPGDVAYVTLGERVYPGSHKEGETVLMVRGYPKGRQDCWRSAETGVVYQDHEVSNARPAVVIDPEQVMVDGTFAREFVTPMMLPRVVANIAAHLDENDDVPTWVAVLRALSAALQQDPPKPDEPTDPTARVTDRRENIWRLLADGEWVCTSGPDIGEYLVWSRLATERGPLTVEVP